MPRLRDAFLAAVPPACSRHYFRRFLEGFGIKQSRYLYQAPGAHAICSRLVSLMKCLFRHMKPFLGVAPTPRAADSHFDATRSRRARLKSLSGTASSGFYFARACYRPGGRWASHFQAGAALIAGASVLCRHRNGATRYRHITALNYFCRPARPCLLPL